MREISVAQEHHQESAKIRFEKALRQRHFGVQRALRRLRGRFRQSGAGHGARSGDRTRRSSQGGGGERSVRDPSALSGGVRLQGARHGGGQEQRAGRAVGGEHRSHHGHAGPLGARRPVDRADIGRWFRAAVLADRATRRQSARHQPAVVGRRVHRTAEHRPKSPVPSQGRQTDRVGAGRVHRGLARPVRRRGRSADRHRQRAHRAQRRSRPTAHRDRRQFRSARPDARDGGRSAPAERFVRR